MNQVFSTIRNVSWRWREKSDPAYAHLYVEGTEGDSNCEGDASRKQTFFYHSSSDFLRLSLMFLFLMFATTSLIASFYMGQHLAKKECQSSYFHLDPIWGKIPLRTVRWVNDSRFMNTDPTKGRFFSNKGGNWTVWDEIHRGSWIQLAPSKGRGISGGLPLSLYSANGSWPNGKEGYVPSVLHQLHCVGLMNHWKLELMSKAVLSEEEIEHMGHCIEFIRHAILCFGDTTLEKPADHSQFVHVDFESSEHLCRDWSYLSSQFWDSSIDFIWGTEMPMTVFENVDAARGNPHGRILSDEEMA